MFQTRVVCSILLVSVISCLAGNVLAGETDTVQVAQLASAADGYFSCAVTTTGGVKCWGRNDGGQLGDGTALGRGVPADVVGLASGVVDVATGSHHACAVTNAGEVKCWGQNWNGELGNGTRIGSYTAVPVTDITDAVAVTAGVYHTCALTATGSVMCWGLQSSGVSGWDSSLVPVPVTGLADVVAIAAGAIQTCALTSSGEVKCWGRHPHETVTPVPNISNAVAIAAGGRDTCAVTASGTVKCWDWYEFLQLPLEVVPGISNADSVGVGSHHACAVTATGAVWSWGYNWNGELGDGTTTRRFTPVAVVGLANAVTVTAGYGHSCAVTTSGGVECWGDNSDGQLGNGHLPQSTVPVIPRGLGSGVASVAVGDWHNCTLSDSGTTKCWGGNWFGQLGDGSTTSRSGPVPVSGLPDGMLTTIAPGYNHTCAITLTGGVKCWGENRYGQLGTGTTVDSSTPVDVALASTDSVTAIAIGDWHTCVLTTAGAVKCWGSNRDGQLGNGDSDDRSTPVVVSGLANDDVVDLTAGFEHTCVLTAAGDVKCWGVNWSGELGDGTTIDRRTPVPVVGITDAVAITAGSESTCALRADGTVKCWGSGGATGLDEDALTPMPVPGLADVVSVDVGANHRCVLISTGEVKCWGENTYGQLGDGSTTSRATPVTVQGLDGIVNTISTRAYQTCALNLAGEVQCWGSNHTGELGIGGPLDSLTPVYVIGFGNWNVIFQDGFEGEPND